MISERDTSRDGGSPLIWLAAAGIIGLVLVMLYADADQQDSGYHYLFARWAWEHPAYFVNVWARPLFTLVYSLPAQAGYAATKIFTLLIALATGWQTWRLARDLGLARAGLVVPLLILQPSCFLLFTTALTEPLFALIFVAALRLHLSGRKTAGALTASLLILVRPEGFFIGLLWGVVLLIEDRFRMLPRPLLLASGMLLWWISALLLTGDPLWIAHNWPSDWQVASQANGTGPIWWYLILLPLIVGPFFLPWFIRGLIRSLRQRIFLLGAASFLTLFCFHSVMYWRGWFGSAGYARYLVCVSPAIAIISLIGWNASLEGRAHAWRSEWLLAPALIFCLCYVDIWPSQRDAIAIDEVHNAYLSDPASSRLTVSHLITSQAYMRIVMDHDIGRTPALTGSRETNLKRIRDARPGTLIFWESQTGPAWYHLYPQDFHDAGFRELVRRRFEIKGRFLRIPEGFFGGPRVQDVGLYYRP